MLAISIGLVTMIRIFGKISDWRMPDMDGLEFYKRAKKEDLLNGVPFLMVSAENERGRIAEALKAGVSDYIFKPVDLKILR